jgi:hypothetical protein
VKIQIEITRPGWLRAPRTWRTRMLLALAIAAVAAVPVAWASHQFADVPNSNPHHDDIGAIFGARITAGCNPPANTLYCPDQAVRRDQMGSFLRRGLSRAAQGSFIGEPVLATDGSWTDLSIVNITAGGTTGGTGFVHLTASFTGYISSTTGCACSARFRILRVSPAAQSLTHYAQPPTAIPSGIDWSLASGSISWVVPVPTGASHQFRLQGQRYGGTGTIRGYGRVNAVYTPFGSTGGATLGEAADAPLGEVSGG